MPDFSAYTSALTALLVILITMLAQSLIASVSKAREAGAVPGKVDDSLGHTSFVFRSHRTFMNSMENVPLMLGTGFLAILAGANLVWTGVLLWVFAIARLLHMVLYYKIATDKNPSPRSYFYLLGMLSNIILLGFCALALV